MTPERWRQVDELFKAALESAPRERSAFLEQACADDEPLRQEVESLIASYEQGDSFLERPAVASAAHSLLCEEGKSLVGSVIAHYRLVSPLGRGGMGEVYLAEDARLGRKVALKLLDTRLTGDTEPRARFLREAQLASTLTHPNVCTIYDVGEAEGRLFIAMQYVEGETLRDVIGGRPLPLDCLLSYALQVAGALAAAHAAGIVHRDVKAGNIIVTPEGEAKVLDFGLAKLLETAGGEAETHLTMTGAVMGTPSSMSPEQARGERVDHRSDIFSFGVVLYEMATGRIPFEGKSRAEVISALLKDAHTPAAESNGEVPARLSSLIDRALAKEPAGRYQSMDEMIAELRQVVAEAGSLDHLFSSGGARVGEVTPYVPPPRRRTLPGTLARAVRRLPVVRAAPAPAVFIGIALLGLLVGAVGLSYFATNRNRADSGAPGKKSIAVLPLKPVNAANRDELYEIGVADSLIHRLSSMRGFVVRPLSATRRYADVEQDPIAAGREQQVDYVLASNYQLAGGKIRVTAQLFNVGNGQVEETYKSEKDAGDVFAMQDAIAGEVGNILQGRFATVSSSPRTKRGTENEEAYRLYLQGMYFNDKRQEPEAWQAIEAFEQAVRLDPNYARAWAGIAHARRGVSNFGRDVDIHEQHRLSMEAVKRALELDPNLSEAHSTLCENKYNYEYDFAGAETACKRAIELDPNSPLAHNIYARFLNGPRRRFDEAVAEIKTAIDLEPTSVFHQVVYTVVLTYARRYDETARQLERLAQRNPRAAVNYFWLVGGVVMNGDHAAAFERLTRFQKLAGTDEETVRIFKTAYESAGWQGVLREQAKRAFDYNPSPFFQAILYAQIGDKDQAFEYLEKSFQRREQWMAYLQSDPRLDPLRGDPRFDELVRRVELR